MKRYFILAAGLLLALPDVQAQTATAARTAPTVAITPGQRKAAEEMLQAANTEKNLASMIDKTLTVQIQQHPEIKSLETEMRAFLAKYMSWSALKDDMVEVYAREFTESEMREISKFYQTPPGQKLNARLPDLMQAGMEIGQQRVQKHLPELEAIMKEKIEAQQKSK